jgi:hypothetical protein
MAIIRDGIAPIPVVLSASQVHPVELMINFGMNFLKVVLSVFAGDMGLSVL